MVAINSTGLLDTVSGLHSVNSCPARWLANHSPAVKTGPPPPARLDPHRTTPASSDAPDSPSTRTTPSVSKHNKQLNSAKSQLTTRVARLVFTINKDKPTRCPECGCGTPHLPYLFPRPAPTDLFSLMFADLVFAAYKVDYQGLPEDAHHH